MNDLRKAAEMALEALEAHADIGIKSDKAVEALRQALAQEEKPPIKTYCGGKPNYCTPVDAANMTQERVDETVKSEHVIDFTDEQLIEEVRRRGFVIRNAQVGKKWVGLTDEDKQEAFDETQEASGGFWEFADYLEAKLKEKNT